ncbi:recombinase family protein [Phenylobacterium aquaticum]|uniref:recombinase family protein n=1 Tax=Phenylobacterium aquaticum TaxID=1763816 RepID=UPI0026EFB2CD|nr:recombinase family protein [Phenylobacterium aquaticum]
MSAIPIVRCAIYTRKSSEEGLEQSFNSLHAQREACEAYIRSQSGEGWVALADHYDDGGYSGGGMERPALRRLLADVSAKRIDVVVVYKVDRLTRFLPDFARIVDALDKCGASFVSITQQFNTTSSTGRLTLNVLLSFAQFEREVTGERIRDKISASKAKGMWMGGLPPLGYDPPIDKLSRALVVNDEEAETVRLIFRRYLELGNVGALQRWLRDEGLRTKRWVSSSGRLMGGYPFGSGVLLPLLKNRTYLGEITHKGASFPGRHRAIIDPQTFDAVQLLLADNSLSRRQRPSPSCQMLLQGLVFDADGQPMVPIINRARKRTYKYYGSAPPCLGGMPAAHDQAIRRAPAADLETFVSNTVARLAPMTDDREAEARLRALVGRVEVHPSSVHLVIRIRGLPGSPTLRSAMEALHERLVPGENALPDPSHAGLIRVLLPVRLVMRGGRTWANSCDGRPLAKVLAPNPRLVSRLRSGHAVLKACCIDPGVLDTTVWKRAEAPKTGSQRQMVQLALLAPEIQRAILRGEVQMPWTDERWGQVPLTWSDQRAMFLGNPAGKLQRPTSMSASITVSEHFSDCAGGNQSEVGAAPDPRPNRLR